MRTGSAAPPIIELSDVFQHVNGRCALNSLSLRLDRGGSILLIGPNGAGKTLSLRLMLGLDQPSAGQVKLFGCDLATINDRHMNALRRHIGAVLQGGSLLDGLTVLENLLLPLRARSYTQADRVRAVRLVVTLLRLDGMEHYRPRSLSLGQQRRAELARALVNRPELVICDGISDGLDRSSVLDILEILRLQRESRGLTFIATDNNLLDTSAPEDRIAVLDRGRLLFDGTKTELESAIATSLELRAILEGHP